MPVIVVANPKGGVGKSTLSSNIAGYFARQGHKVMLGDIDRQQSSRLWLQLRPDTLPAVQSWDLDRDDIVRPPKGTTHVVLDTPAGLAGKRLDAAMKIADRVLIPLQASVFDIYPTRDFISRLMDHKRSEQGASWPWWPTASRTTPRRPSTCRSLPATRWAMPVARPSCATPRTMPTWPRTA
jgi:chromosome partitioning protein